MLFGQLLTSIEQKFCRDDGKAYGSLGAWAGKTPVILDGRPFSPPVFCGLLESEQRTDDAVGWVER
jgi:hypothetical protein